MERDSVRPGMIAGLFANREPQKIWRTSVVMCSYILIRRTSRAQSFRKEYTHVLIGVLRKPHPNLQQQLFLVTGSPRCCV